MLLLLLTALAVAAGAVPAPEPTPAPDPAAVTGVAAITNYAQLNASLSVLSKDANSAFAVGYTSMLAAIKPSATPTADAQIALELASLAAAYPSNPLAAGGALLLSGLTGGSQIGNPAADAQDFGACNSNTNTNTAQPDRTIYPKQSSTDAPYDISEAQLRAAIYFPPTFTNGKTKPVLFIPGTGVEACENFAPNIGKLIAGSSYADPVYVNVPTNMCEDEQTSAEYVAYAINYVSAITGNQNVSVVTWSAGGAITQWALKYWSSTRQYVSAFVAFSPDYHGTIETPLICPPGVPCTPSILQQEYTASWIAQLRKNGGSNSLVPTTEIHDIFDEVVEPQTDPLASADLGNGGIGVTNVQIQDYCPVGTFAGGPNFGHENPLYNPVGIAIALDALKYGGVANPTRAGPYNCSQIMATGLSYSDVFATEFLVPLAGFNVVAYATKVTVEPTIKPYATY